MKRLILIAGVLMAGTVFLAAQTPVAGSAIGSEPLQQPLKDGNGERLIAGLLVQEMRGQLNLTDAQVKQVTSLLEEKVTAMQGMREDSSSTQQVKDITMAFNTKVDAILTSEQKAKWKEYQEGLMEKAKARYGDLVQKAPVKGEAGTIAISNVSAPAASPVKEAGVKNYAPAMIFLNAVKDAKLNLTDSQIDKIVDAYQERSTAWGVIQNNASLSDDQRIDQCFAATKVCLAKVDAILDAGQRAKRDACLKAGLNALKQSAPSK